MNLINHLKVVLACLVFSTLTFPQDQDGVSYEDILIELIVTGCYGHCPAFSITIDGKGDVEYEGFQYVSKLGKKTKTISRKKVAQLLSSIIVDMRFFKRKDTSNNCNTHIESDGGYIITPGICIMDSHSSKLIIAVKFGGQYRKVRLEYYYSDDYEYLKDHIIKATGIKRWVKWKK